MIPNNNNKDSDQQTDSTTNDFVQDSTTRSAFTSGDVVKSETIINNDASSSSSSSQPPKSDTSTSSSDAAETSTEKVLRENVGHGMTTISDVINDNLVAFRYGTVATVTLLTAYGLANTPLFFRYKRVSDIPAQLFTSRKRLRARLIQTVDNDQAGQPITCYVRHLSPAGSFLSRNLYDYAVKFDPSAQVAKHNNNYVESSGSSIDTNIAKANRDLLKVEIAGLSAPPFYKTGGYQRGEWLRRLADEKTMVKLQLLGRRVVTTNNNDSVQRQSSSKRDVTSILPEVQPTLDDLVNNKQQAEQVAVCRIYYRPSWFQIFATDLANTLVRYGHASVEPEIFMNNEHTNQVTEVVDASSRLEDIRKDVRYLDRLGKLEYEAAKKSYGMWADPIIRETRRDIVDEIEFQATANIFQRLRRWMRS